MFAIICSFTVGYLRAFGVANWRRSVRVCDRHRDSEPDREEGHYDPVFARRPTSVAGLRPTGSRDGLLRRDSSEGGWVGGRRGWQGGGAVTPTHPGDEEGLGGEEEEELVEEMEQQRHHVVACDTQRRPPHDSYTS